jgi:hypothetical protein
MSRVVRRVNGAGPGRKTYVARVAGRRHRPVRTVRAVLEHGKNQSPERYLGRRRSPKGCAERQLRLITSQ